MVSFKLSALSATALLITTAFAAPAAESVVEHVTVPTRTAHPPEATIVARDDHSVNEPAQLVKRWNRTIRWCTEYNGYGTCYYPQFTDFSQCQNLPDGPKKPFIDPAYSGGACCITYWGTNCQYQDGDPFCGALNIANWPNYRSLNCWPTS